MSSYHYEFKVQDDETAYEILREFRLRPASMTVYGSIVTIVTGDVKLIYDIVTYLKDEFG